MDKKTPFPHRRPILRWVDYARRSWQRVGHLRVLCAVAHPGTRTNLEGLSNRFESVVTALHDVPEGFQDRVREYIRAYRRNRYRGRENLLSSVELQDLYLSDPLLPSQSGAITGDAATAGYRHAVYVEMPTWGVRLRLLRRDNYTLTDRGKVLRGLRRNSNEDIRTFNASSNIYLVTPGERFFYLYCVLDVDGDLVKGIFSYLLQQERSFSRREVGHIAAKTLENLSASRLSRVVGGQERLVKDRIAATIKSIGSQTGSGMGPCESVATPRTEPLVDCGILERTDKSSYDYHLSDEGRKFAQALVESASIDDFLETNLAKWSVDLSKNGEALGNEPRDVRHFIAKGYSQLRSGLGYCSIREIAMMATAMAIDEGACPFELADAEYAISELARNHGRDVRFTKSRQGEIAQVRIAPRVLAGFNDDDETTR